MSDDRAARIEQLRSDIESAKVRIKNEERYIITMESTLTRLRLEVSDHEENKPEEAPASLAPT